MFCVALAVGTLAATGLLVLIPEVVVILTIIWRPSSVRHNSVVIFFHMQSSDVEWLNQWKPNHQKTV